MDPAVLVKLLLGVGPAEAPPREKRFYEKGRSSAGTCGHIRSRCPFLRQRGHRPASSSDSCALSDMPTIRTRTRTPPRPSPIDSRNSSAGRLVEYLSGRRVFADEAVADVAGVADADSDDGANDSVAAASLHSDTYARSSDRTIVAHRLNRSYATPCELQNSARAPAESKVASASATISFASFAVREGVPKTWEREENIDVSVAIDSSERCLERFQ